MSFEFLGSSLINLTVLIDGECDAAVSMPDHIKEKREKAAGRRQVM